MTIRNRLLLAFSVMTLMVIMLGAFTLYRLSIAQRFSNQLVDHTVPSLVVVEQMSANLAKYRSLQASHIAVRNDTEQQQIEQALDDLDKRQRELIASYTALAQEGASDTHEQEAALWLEAQWSQFVKTSQTVLIPTSRQHIGVTAYAVYTSQEREYTNLDSTIASLVDDTQAELRERRQESETIQQQSLAVVIGATLLAVIGSALLWHAFSRSITRSIDRLVEATRLVATGTYDRLVEASGADELATLAQSFNQMQAALRQAREELDAKQTDLEKRTQELECTLEELRSTEVARDELSETVRSLSSPVLPVMEGVLVVPLTGVIDSHRALLFTEMELAAIEQYAAHTVIVDVTGVPIIDTAVAGALLRAAEAASLLGAETVLVGLRPELAHTIVGLGVDLSRLVTRADLAAGVRYAAARHAARKRITNGRQAQLTPANA